jgi:multiple sugar transport system substrate-binding protein
MPTLRDVRTWLAAIAVGGALGVLGCGWQGGADRPPEKPYQGMKLVVAAVGDPALLASVASQRGEWEATRGAQITIRDGVVDPTSTEGIDVLVFPGDRLGELVDAQALAVVPESALRPPPRPEPETGESSGGAPGAAPADPLQFSDILPVFRDQVSKYGKDRLALPFGGSALVLAYRRDAFDREEVRAAAKKENLELKPPATWTELDALARFFQGRDWDGDGQPDFGISLALGGDDPERLGASTYLARAAALGQHRDQYSFLFDSDSMAPRIKTPPFVEALRGLVALKASGPPGIEKFNAEAARAAFRKGNVAMLVDRAERAGEWAGGKGIGVAPLPGSERVFNPATQSWETATPPNRPSYLPQGGGWLIGVVRRAGERQRAAAIDFAKYLIGPETSVLIRANRARPMLPVRAAQLGQGPPDSQGAAGVDPRSWSESVSRTLNAERVVPGLRIPRADSYLADLDQARSAALDGKSPESVLEAAAKSWTERTGDLGTSRQLWHYRRSLNNLVTTPEPPSK